MEVDDVARYPLPGSNAAASAAFSPDGRWVAFLWSTDHSLRRGLFVHEVDTGEVDELMAAGGPGGVTEEGLSLEERLRRERQRDLGQGITSFAWAKEANRLLVPLPDGLRVLDAPSFEPRLVASAEDGPLVDPQLSPDGSMVAFVRHGELFVVGCDGATEAHQLTRPAEEPGTTHGLAEFIAQEEMDRRHGFWWSPDGRLLAFTEVDETRIPVYRIVHQGSDTVGEGAQEDHRYPFAGGDNARVRLAVVDAAGGDPVWMELGHGWEYLARVDWLAPGLLVAQLQNRDQTRLDLVALDPATGSSRPLLSEESDVWVNLHDLLRPLAGDRFLWASERSGFRHLEVRSAADGSLERVLTEGDWQVETVVEVGEDRVWFTATRDSPLERHLYEVPLEGGPVRRLSDGAGTHAGAVDCGRGRMVDTWSTTTRPPEAVLRSLEGQEEPRPLLPADARPDPRLAELDLRPPELVTVETPDGVTLHAALYRPPGVGPFPTIVSVYGGPHVQRVTDSWGLTAGMRHQYLRSLGFLVVVADNRGSAGRGLAFEAPIRWYLGNVEVADQATVVRWLVAEGLADPARVGIYGWSYGGYMSALSLAKAPEVFRVAVAGAPVTSWDGYDSHYTERYMGLPEHNPDGYRASSVMTHVAGLKDRRLLLVHGLIDENVHFRHTARLVNALIRERIPYELLLFPDERHVPRSEADRVFMEERIRDFFLAHL
ncbi:MAG: S9 family peptidase [Actinobacteria bacterium]|nr:S9 family peptidase [Actinomycetota bacterium]MBW3649174.1 S9 family peptidase [Actinomycetota bacterium]